MDNLFLRNGGTAVDIGSYLRADPGPDFGERDLLQAAYSQNPLVDGGALAYEQAGVRKMAFPLLLPTGGAGLSLSGLESLLRVLARPGATLDVKLQGVPTGDAVRFDVLTGRYEPEYNIRHHEAGRRMGTLELDVQPFGYLPTWIVLASAASVGLPGELAIPNASLIGDVPGLLALAVQPSNPAVTTGAGTWLPDMLAWSVVARPSFAGFLRGASWTSAVPSGAYAARSESVTGTVLQWMLASNFAGWTALAYYDIPAAVEPAYRGRFRAYAYARQSINLQGEFNSMRVSLDAAVLNPSAPLASAQPVATLPVQAPTVYAPNLLDLGEIVLPPVASGVARAVRLRLWAAKATGAATTQTFGDLHGISLLPLDGPNGVLPRGLAYPERGAASFGTFAVDAYDKTAVIAISTGPYASSPAVVDALRAYRGGLPRVGASSVSLSLIGGSRRKALLTWNDAVNAIAWRNRWRLDEAAGQATMVDDYPGPDVPGHGRYLGNPSVGQPGHVGSSRGVAFGPSGMGFIDGQLVRTGDTFTIEAWTRRNAPGTIDWILAQGQNVAFRGLQFGYYSDDAFYLNTVGQSEARVLGTPDTDQLHHWVGMYRAASRTVSIFKDAVLVASSVATPFLGTSTDKTAVGAAPTQLTAAAGFDGVIDDVVYYQTVLATDTIRNHYEAGMAERAALARPAPAHAAVSVLYRPRFAFLKGGV